MAKLNHIIRLFRRDEDGTALVEMAIVAPFVLLLSAGVFEFSNMLNTRLLLEAGVEDAARYMARCSSDWDTCKGLAQNLAANGAVDGTSARVPGWLPTQVTITKSSTQAMDTTTTPPTQLYLSSKSTVDVVIVSTAYTYPDVGFWSYLGFGDLTLSVVHQERVFGW
ncbi:MAG: pilus assembly protein [Mesorhizobium sp.]|uniref:TadE/TadG family type IV pilus assembly protein n=1 Tax=Mesorhizobium sp. TaxID=1871066 RepID=UPI000FE98580|nr:TadE/TadG family type IV pilus assembly protein [Mesorhizobium sp.]RWD61708.1 MAG: pilus assembly protein [Mesorhizobium sp.]RWE41865.1 MAG: pilus assembly protein [Mesorhizobium sp.]TIV72532.1 MAG: pilus assembly protein [Mesorhizobium sp.]